MIHTNKSIIFRHNRKFELQNFEGLRIGEVELVKGKELICRSLEINDTTSDIWIEIGWIRNVPNKDYFEP